MEKGLALQLKKAFYPVHPSILCAEFVRNWPSGSAETISYLSPLGKGHDPHLNKLASPLPQDALCQVSLKLALWFWRMYCLCIFAISLLSPLGTGHGP